MATVADVIGVIESSNNPAAMRFEYATYQNAPYAGVIIDAIKTRNLCNIATARMIYATSWGEFQIMGFNLYSPDVCAYRNNIARYLIRMGDQLATFHAMLFRLPLTPKISEDDNATVFNDPNLRLQFARLYNGAGDFHVYADRIKALTNAE